MDSYTKVILCGFLFIAIVGTIGTIRLWWLGKKSGW
jgi:hypothetical protein